jgi:hypothetical protein
MPLSSLSVSSALLCTMPLSVVICLLSFSLHHASFVIYFSLPVPFSLTLCSVGGFEVNIWRQSVLSHLSARVSRAPYVYQADDSRARSELWPTVEYRTGNLLWWRSLNPDNTVIPEVLWITWALETVPPVPIGEEGEWTPEQVWTTWRKLLILPGLELRSLCHPARSQSLYRLHYPDSLSAY